MVQPALQMSQGGGVGDLLRERTQTGIGVHDALSAILATKEAFDFLWVSSFALSAVAGLPDLGLLNRDDMLTAVRVLGRATTLPLVIDLDSGYGTPLQTHFMVNSLLASGVSAVCIEDNPVEKRSSLYDGYERVLVPIPVHEARIRAARIAIDTRGADCAVIARTEALVAGEGLAAALRRAEAYVGAGADAVFVQCVAPTAEELFGFLEAWHRRTPVFLAPTRYPDTPRAKFHGAGATHVIYANHALRAAHAAMARTMRVLANGGSANDVEPELSSVATVSTDVGEPAIRALNAMLSPR
jgi:phosphoenolpyruvate phosphomutase